MIPQGDVSDFMCGHSQNFENEVGVWEGMSLCGERLDHSRLLGAGGREWEEVRYH